MLRRIVFGLVSAMGLLCAVQTLDADQATCLISIEPKSCTDLYGAWPGNNQPAFACGANLCGATRPLPTCTVANTWKESVNEAAWGTEQPAYRVPITPETGFNRKPSFIWDCKWTAGCVGCQPVVNDPNRPDGDYCLAGMKSRDGAIQLWTKVDNTPCAGIEGPN